MDEIDFLCEYTQCHFEWETGQMTLNLDYFFPCPLNNVRKVFRLINEYATEEEKENLYRYLRIRIRECMEFLGEYGDKIMDSEAPDRERYGNARYREKRTAYRRYKNNISLLERRSR